MTNTSGQRQLDIQQLSMELGFPLRSLGVNLCPIFPQRVGRWWLQPISTAEGLPERATSRLAALARAGVRPKAVVLFHEIPKAEQLSSPTPGVGTLLGGAKGWLDRNGRHAAETASRMTARYTPIAGKVLLQLSLAALVAAGAIIAGLLTLLGMAIAAAATDPCLVIVTQEGDWLEVDRWFE